MTEDEMVGWHHRLYGHEFEQTLGDGEGQGSLMCCGPLGDVIRLISKHRKAYHRDLMVDGLVSSVGSTVSYKTFGFWMT